MARSAFFFILITLVSFSQSLFAAEPRSEDWERERWVHRSARALRAGRDIQGRDLIRRLLEKSDEEIVDYFLAKDEFGDAVLDFNIFYLGFRRDYLREPNGELHERVFDFPQAIQAAREVLTGGDYFKLYDLDQPAYMVQLRHPYSPDPADQGVPSEELRRKLFDRIQQGLRQQIAALEADPSRDIQKACADFLKEFREGGQLGDAGLPVTILDIGILENSWYGKVVEICLGPLKPVGVDFKAELENLYRLNEKLIAALPEFEASRYSTRDLRQVKALDVVGLGILSRYIQFAAGPRMVLMNSSTNYNRKRAAHVLSRFFCDDLTPIAVELPENPPGGAHGSDPACMACHYKLDPMAGFFRDYGYMWGNYSGQEHIRFDDNATAKLTEYHQAWKAAPESGREWNVGYIRSSTRDRLNSYGSSLDDLFQIIRTAPEARRCLVRRMFEYFVGGKQAIDAGYLEHLTGEFTKAVETSESSAAFKATAKRIVLSRSFRATDPVADECYDYPPEYDPSGKPPCKVSHILRKNCVACHSSTGDEPYLDLGSWVTKSDGKQGFPHLDAEGNEVPRSTTFEKLIYRLTTTEPGKRMPMGRHMDALEREQLFTWANQMLGFAPRSVKKGADACPVVR